MSIIEDSLSQIQRGQDLSAAVMQACISELMSGLVPSEKIESLLSALHHKGETVEELVGAARALREKMRPVRLRQTPLVDTCGTGGDGSMTFNISTAAAIVAAACGVFVAKHGNRKITSQSGSADVLVELGVNISCDQAAAQRCMDRANLCFLYAPEFHPAMRFVAEARKRLPFPTIFNLLGPLANPASAAHQVLGVGKAEAWDLLVPALSRLAGGRSLAVRGQDGLGELSVLARSQVAIIENGQSRIEIWDPQDFGLSGGNIQDLQVRTPAESADLIRQVFDQTPGAARNIVVFNAAAAIWLARQADNLQDAVKKSQAAIDSGQAAQTLQKLALASQQEHAQ